MESCPSGRRCSTRNAVYVTYLGFESLTLRQKSHRNFDRIAVDFFYARKLHEIKAFAALEHKRTPPQSDSAAGFSAFFGFYGGLSESKR